MMPSRTSCLCGPALLSPILIRVPLVSETEQRQDIQFFIVHFDLAAAVSHLYRKRVVELVRLEFVSQVSHLPLF